MLAQTRRALLLDLDRRSFLLASQICARASALPNALQRLDRPLSNAGRTFSTSHAVYDKAARHSREVAKQWKPGGGGEYRKNGKKETFGSLVGFKPVPELMSLYQGLKDAQKVRLDVRTLVALSKRLTFKMQVGRFRARSSPKNVPVLEFAQILASDIQNGKVKPVPTVCAHLLSIYHAAGSVQAAEEWWAWLQTQDNDSGAVSSGAYAAAIRFLASQGKSIAQLEALYSEALTRWPGTFQEYHLSANAVLSDRDQYFSKPVPLRLLDAMAGVRLAKGSTTQAYLTLDTVLRLMPSEPYHGTVGHFMETRPLPEALTVHAMSCRSGRPLGLRVREFLERIKLNSANCSSKFGSILAARQMLSILYLEIGAGAMSSQQSGWVDLVVSTMTHVMKVPGILLLPQTDKQTLVDIVSTNIRKVLEIFGSMRCNPTADSFSHIISDLAGLGQNKDLIRMALDDAGKLGIEPTYQTMRAILTAAGRIGDPALVKESWHGLVEYRANTGNGRIHDGDIHGLIKAARQSGISDFAREIIEQIKNDLPGLPLPEIMQHLDEPGPDTERTGEAPDMNAYVSLLEKLRADLDVFAQKLTGQTPPHNFKDQNLPTRFRRPLPEEQVAEADLRRIYDEMSTDPTSQTPSETNKDPALSLTDIPLGELRFEHWKDINFLLAQAVRHDAACTDAINATVASDPNASGIDAERRLWRGSAKLDEDSIYGLSDVPKMTADHPATDPDQFEKVRQEIFRLRGVVPVSERHATT